MMELGNIIFGHSRGTCKVDRRLQDLFGEFLEKLGFDGDGVPDRERAPKGWTELPYRGFTNETFIIRPYYWGDCDCGWEEKDFSEEHRPDCYDTRRRELKRRLGKDLLDEGSCLGDTPAYVTARAELLKELRLPYQGCEAHCTCDYPQRYEAWFEANKLGPEGHAETCPMVLPNFVHLPSGFTMQWYKYALRDSYSSKRLTAEMIAGWIKESRDELFKSAMNRTMEKHGETFRRLAEGDQG